MTIPFFALVGLTLANAAGTPLWRDVRAGMSESEFQATHPADADKVVHRRAYSTLKKAQPIGDCQADVQVYYPEGNVTKVVVVSRPHGILQATCGDDVEPALIAKYGEPTTRDTRSFTFGIENEDRTFTWRANGVLVVLERKAVKSDDTWSVTYQPIVDVGL